MDAVEESGIIVSRGKKGKVEKTNELLSQLKKITSNKVLPSPQRLYREES